MSDQDFSIPSKQAESYRSADQIIPYTEIYQSPETYRLADTCKNQKLKTELLQPDQKFYSETIMYTEMKILIKQLNQVMDNCKIFFSKYLLPEENYFNMTQIQKQYVSRSQQSQSHQIDASTQFQNTRVNNCQHYPKNEQNNHQNEEKYETHEVSVQNKLTQNSGPSKKNVYGFNKKTHPRDPNRPKGPLTPYFLFFQQTREILRKKYPQMSLAQIGSLGGKIWRQLSESQRQNYKDRYEQAKIQFKAKMRQYNSLGVIYQSRGLESGPQETETVIDQF